MTAVLVDTGPLVALLNARDRYHPWARDTFNAIKPPIRTCEPVLTEACFLLRRLPGGEQTLLRFAETRLLMIEFRLLPELQAIRGLMHRFANVPMSLADACLVRMSELERDSVIVTLDSDFRVYRRNRRQTIPTVMPA